MKKLKKPLSIILAVLMVMSVFIAVPMTASALTGNDVDSLLNSMHAVINGYMEQHDFEHAQALINYYNSLSQKYYQANQQVTPEVESAYNAAYEYFMENGGAGVSYPDVNNVYMATDEVVEVTVADLQRGDVIVTSSEPLEVQKGNCNIVLVGGTYGEGEDGTLYRMFPNNVTLGDDLIFEFTDNNARIVDLGENHGRYDAVYNNALGNAYMVLANENGTVYLAGYNFVTYTITWKDYNGSDLYDGQSTVAAGTVPYYRWSVSRNSTAQYTYTFTGWTDSSNTFYSKDSNLPAASKDETYTATYSETLRSYTITWKDGDDNTLKSESVAYGTTPSYTGATPTKTEDDAYTYEFNNTWSPSVASVTGNATYTAQFTSVPKPAPTPTYTVTWKNGETVLKTDTVEEGNAPAYTGNVPEKAEDENNTYTFSGWTDGTTTYGATDTLPAVTGDITYTATYTASAKSAKTIAAGETYYIGDSIAFTDAPPFVYVRYDDDTYGDYTAYLIGGDNTTVTAPTYDSRGGQWKFNDVLRYEPWASARPLRITDTNDRTPIGFKCSGGTGTSSDPFTFECVYESAPELFPQHSVSLGGDIGVNFYIDPAAANADEHATVSVEFSWNGQTRTVNAEYDDNKGLFKATCDVVAAEVACDITAVATVNGETQAQTDTYSVQKYAEAVYNNPTEYDTKGRPDELQALAKALLNYGAMAQTVFVEYMKQPVKAPADIVKTVEKTDFNAITADDIPGGATDLAAIATDLGCTYYTSSVLYLSKNTLRLYFTPNTYQDAMPHVDDFKGNQSEYYYYVEKENIAAAELDNQQSFTIGDKTFTFSALDYAKAVVNSDMGGDQKDLAKSLYLYNKAANEYFDDGSAPEPAVTSFTKVTDTNQIAEDNIGECTFEEAKAWVLANWDDIRDNDKIVDVAYFDGTDLKTISLYPDMSKQDFEEQAYEENPSINDLQFWFTNFVEDIYLCSKAS